MQTDFAIKMNRRAFLGTMASIPPTLRMLAVG